MGEWVLFWLLSVISYLLGYFSVKRFGHRLMPLFKGCSMGGAVLLIYGIVLGAFSAPALVYVLLRYPWLLRLPSLSLESLIALALTISGLALATYSWDRLVPGVTELDYSFLAAARCRLFLTLILVYILGPVLEEVVYRGLVQYTLSQYIGSWAALAISTLAFAAPHIRILGPKNAPLILAISLALGLLLLVYDSLTPSILAHIAVNAAGGVTGLRRAVNTDRH